MEEIWKDIPGYEGKYQVSNMGDVMSLNYNKTGKSKIMTPGVNGKGYRFVKLWKDGGKKTYLLHRLVYEVFKGEIPEGMQIGHIDETPGNDIISNLMLCTSAENNNWGTRKEKVSKALKNSAKLSKRVEQYTIEGRFVREWPSIVEIKRELGYSDTTIGRCCKANKTAYGYKWKYA